jgi:sulfatase modifying factor 1
MGVSSMNICRIAIAFLLSVSLLLASQNVYSAAGPWDINQDGVVDKADLDIVIENFGSKNASADVNGDGIVNILDLVLVAKHFGEKYELPNEIIGKDGAPMLLIPAGEFQMGDSFSEGRVIELPVHTVYLDIFYIDKYEVTNAQYKKFMDATGYKAPTYWNDPNYNALDHPVVGVSWLDAVAYAEWADKRLPTEAEWEKAARGGFVGKRYPWGDDISHDNANYDGIGGKDIWGYTSSVGSFAPNGYGLYDVTGNVWEWCADWYDGNYYANSPKSNPTGPESGVARIVRGGAWTLTIDTLRVAYRRNNNPPYTGSIIGFRCSGLKQ